MSAWRPFLRVWLRILTCTQMRAEVRKHAFTNNCLHIWHLFRKKKNDIQHCHCQVNKPACMLHGEWNSRHMCKEFAESGTSSLYRLEQFNIYNASSPILLTKLPLAMEACQAARVSLSLEVAATQWLKSNRPASFTHKEGKAKARKRATVTCV